MTKRKRKGCGKYICMVYEKGYTGNPLLNWGRNDPCICGSGKKFKKCCIHNLPKAIPTNLRDEMLKKPNLKVKLFWEWYLDQKKIWELKQKNESDLHDLDDSVPGVSEITLDDVYEEEADAL